MHVCKCLTAFKIEALELPGLVATSRSSATACTLQPSILRHSLEDLEELLLTLIGNFCVRNVHLVTRCLGFSAATKDVEQTPDR